MPPKAAGPSRQCWYYDNPARCRFGKDCRFQHKSDDASSSRAEDTTRQTASRPPLNPSQRQFREWRRDIPRAEDRNPSKLGYELPAFFQAAWELFEDGAADICQDVVRHLASHGGLSRIHEATDVVTNSCGEADRHRSIEECFMPIICIISHDAAVKSPLLENDVGKIHTFLFGPNGDRACILYPLLTDYAKSLANGTDEGSKRVIVILKFFHKAIDINSTAKVTEPLFPVVESLCDLVSDAMPDANEGWYIIDRTRSRMGLGSIMPTRLDRGGGKDENTLKERVRFNILRDLPGMLSTSGPRHDNDHEDIEDIEILPTSHEIEASRAEYLPVQDPSLLHKPGLEGLVDRLFRLLREDTVGQLRDAVQMAFCELNNPQGDRSSSRYQDRARRNVYRNIRLEDIDYIQATGLFARISFDQPEHLQRKSASHRKQWWSRSKSLNVDALVCVLSTSGETNFMCVCSESRSSDEDASEARLKQLSSHSDRAFTSLRLIEPHQYDISRLASFLSPRTGHIEVCEFPGVLLPSFYPTLRALQRLSTTLDLPFSDLIAPSRNVAFDGTIPPPRYALHPGFSFDLQAIANGTDIYLSLNRSFHYKTLSKNTDLDQAQQAAVIEALTRSLALIQGPPGTGKSYTGIALIKVLLDNAEEANLGPIICVCYTNHALDQLLEHLVKGGVKQVIRIGSRSKSELLRPLNLREVAKEMGHTAAEKRAYWEGKNSLEEATKEFQSHREAIREPGRLEFVKEFLQRENPKQFVEIFQGRADKKGGDIWTAVQRRDRRNALEQWLKPRRGDSLNKAPNTTRPSRELEELRKAESNTMTLAERGKLYGFWEAEIRRKAVAMCAYSMDDAKSGQECLDQVRQESDLRCLNQANVIGLTTSGLARNLSFLRHLRSKVLICEEAGEVLEAHLLTALLPSIEHAILIGDHRQLRPQIQNYELQSDNPRGKQYSLDVSLFERLVQPTIGGAVKVPLSDLRTQRRMHPSISELIRRTIYPDLEDDPSVGQYPAVEGVAKRLFWLNHQHLENGSDREDSTSHSNDYEVDMSAALVSHLVRQGKYQSEDIAIITPYLGQFIKLSKKLAGSFAITISEKDNEELERQGLAHENAQGQITRAEKGTLLQALRIATVDNFQGEEAKVIVVSLVRSNKERKCGFLRTSNRINVLLSRAQHGMYLIGDADTYRNVDMWNNVIGMLEEDQNIGLSLSLCCPRHPGTLIEVSNPDDFAIKAPEGGCDLMCEWRLDCGHQCINKCHSKLLHENVVCQEPCPRGRSSCDHPCQNKCGYPCGLCVIPIPNVELPCGHVAPTLPCHLAQAPQEALCKMPVDRRMSGCGHTIKIPCFQGIPGPDKPCTATCKALLPCGHFCTRACSKCNQKEDGQILNSDHGTCKKVCERQYNTCGHCCQQQCHSGKDCPLCTAPCVIQCSHSKCSKKCSEPCAPCSERCTSECPHNGRCNLPCSVPCSNIPCSLRCKSILECGHQCPSMCGETCPTPAFCQICCDDQKKSMVVDYIMSSSYSEVDLDEDPIMIPQCGHMMTASNMDGHLGMSNHFEMSKEGVPNAVKGESQPFSSEDLKNCPMCRYPIRNINRYNRIIRRGVIDELTKKFITWSNTTFAPLASKVQAIESEFADSQKSEQQHQQPSLESPEGDVLVMKLHEGRDQIVSHINKVPRLSNTFKKAFSIRRDVKAFERKVSDGEQPFGRIWDLVENERRRKGASQDHFPFQTDVLQPRSRLLGSSLGIRCDLAIISEFLAIQSQRPGLLAVDDFRMASLDINFAHARRDCLKLADEAASKHQPLVEVEARIYFARFAALERTFDQSSSRVERAAEMRGHGLEQLEIATEVSDQHPGSVKGMAGQIEAVRRMLNEGTFYSVVTSKETQEVYAALSREFRGTGHWYRCVNGHPFTIGECGMPMETSRCPQCGAQVGGQHHQSVVGVTRDEEMERRMGALTLGAQIPFRGLLGRIGEFLN